MLASIRKVAGILSMTSKQGNMFSDDHSLLYAARFMKLDRLNKRKQIFPIEILFYMSICCTCLLRVNCTSVEPHHSWSFEHRYK
jgi:hypothetical protein